MYLFIIESKDERSAWVSGIFEDESMALQYLNIIPAKSSECQRLVRADYLYFPFYIVEEAQSFIYLNQADVIKRLDSIVQVEDEDKVYFNLYRITQDYQPPEPGIDYMGILNHAHIDNRFLEWYQQDGVDFLIRNGMA